MGMELSAQGKHVRYIRSTFVPGENKCMCLFEAPNPENVREANERAKIPFTRIVVAADLTP
jgi:Nickel responsive protein SCO4226-like